MNVLLGLCARPSTWFLITGTGPGDYTFACDVHRDEFAYEHASAIPADPDVPCRFIEPAPEALSRAEDDAC